MLNELLKSRHYRLKVECLMLLMYTMFNCNGLIWLTSLHLDFESSDHINFFADEDFKGIGVSCVFSLVSVFLFWVFAIRILLQFYHKEKDEKWMKCTKLYAKAASVLWILSMLSWTITVLFTEMDVFIFKIGLAFIPAWNKSLCIGVVYSIFYEFNPAVSRTQRVVRWVSIVTIFLTVYVGLFTVFCGISWLAWFFSWFTGGEWVWMTVYMIFLSIILTPFYNFFLVLWNQLRPDFQHRYYMICVPCCCGCFCHDNWLKCCVPSCCVRDAYVRDTTWLIVGMSFVWVACTILLNDNECLAVNSIIEYAFGFRGAAILVLLFSVLINIELTYTGPIKNRRITDASSQQQDVPAVGLELATEVMQNIPATVELRTADTATVETSTAEAVEVTDDADADEEETEEQVSLGDGANEDQESPVDDDTDHVQVELGDNDEEPGTEPGAHEDEEIQEPGSIGIEDI